MRDEEAVSVRELAGILGVHAQTVYAKASDARPAPEGAIPGFRVGRAWRFFPSEVKATLTAPADPWVRRGKAA